ncbi:MAG TPA: hypothetical protein PLJ84_10750 [Bacteroidales bacterium]|nr:hypothetical protein [Bacteroidales bacterium]
MKEISAAVSFMIWISQVVKGSFPDHEPESEYMKRVVQKRLSGWICRRDTYGMLQTAAGRWFLCRPSVK